MVRQPGDPVVVDRSVAERGLRFVRGVPRRGGGAAGDEAHGAVRHHRPPGMDYPIKFRSVDI